MNLRCIAIDDEPKALEVIKYHCDKIPFAEFVRSFRDPLDAISFLNENKIDLIFLDINMPNVTGMQFLKLLKKQPMVVFVTAYSEYAIESYEYEAIDYLLKPISFERLLKALTKALGKQRLVDSKSGNTRTQTGKNAGSFIYIKSGPKLHKVNLSDIIYLEKDGNYLIFHTESQRILSRQNMKNVFQVLPENKFMRIHRSFIISLDHIQTIESHQVTLINGQQIPIGSNYRDELLDKVNRHHNSKEI